MCVGKKTGSVDGKPERGMFVSLKGEKRAARRTHLMEVVQSTSQDVRLTLHFQEEVMCTRENVVEHKSLLFHGRSIVLDQIWGNQAL